MALYWWNYNSFAEVEKMYNDTKPVVSKNHTKAEDIRPIGDRRRKWERIKKISDDCYVVLDGGYGDDIFGFSLWNEDYTGATIEEVVAFAPIKWERKPCGNEFVTIRNGVGEYAHTGRYQFLDRNIPTGLTFIVQNGKQFVGLRHDAKRYYLPKGKDVPKSWHEYRKSQGYGVTKETYTHDPRNAELVFMRVNDSWRLAQDEHTLPKPPRTLVKKEVKQRYKDDIENFRQYVFAIAPMMDVYDSDSWRGYSWEQNQQMNHDFHQTCAEEFPDLVTPNTRNLRLDTVPSDIALRMLIDYNSKVRYYLAYQFAIHSDIARMQTEEDTKRVKSQFTRWVNKMCDFTYVENC